MIAAISHFITARRNARIASAVLATAIPSVRLSVCLSVCPSHAGTVSKRLQLARCSSHCQIEKILSSFVETKNVLQEGLFSPEILAQTDPPSPESSEV